MELIDIQKIREQRDTLKRDWNVKRPFRYMILENFFLPDKAKEIYHTYPGIDEGHWDGTTYINQKNKYQQREFEEGSIIKKAFFELKSEEFLEEIEYITAIEHLIGDDQLFGGGLHQSLTGAFLDVHVDYNLHPKTKLHRRLNILVYMNQDWKDEYEGHLQLWDMKTNQMIENILPSFNRMAMFETNEISFHGHPKALKSPVGLSRKSLAAYYYTDTRPKNEIADEHNTIYINTEGLKGKVKNLTSGVQALLERVNSRIK